MPSPASWLAIALWLVLFLHPVTSHSEEKLVDAVAYVQSLLDDAVTHLTDRKLSTVERQEHFRDFLLKYCDSPEVQERILGRYWKRASASELSEYLQLVEDYVVVVYAGQFDNYSPLEHIVVTGADTLEGPIVVHSVAIDPTDPPPTRVDWTLTPKPDHRYKIADVRIDGVSVVETVRDDFISAIEFGDGTITALLAAMRAKISKLKSGQQHG